ncbi:MAG: hypothetical protein AUG74_15110 [Bacteroidetes bacterium 13_1_20CM_4_60_6]|nr:MAG: hypothetical protein AUG74_15110 [Bacteroidetes bacterium 13_1_20CM_4_60_6]
MLPFLDLDTVREDPVSTRQVFDCLRSRFNTFEPARVRVGEVPGWHNLKELQNAAQRLKGRTLLTGTVRNVQGTRRVSIRLLNPANGETLFAKVLNQNELQSNPSDVTEDWSRKIYDLLIMDNWSEFTNSNVDPGLRDKRASETIRAAEAALANYTISDLDNAIRLFTKAIDYEPSSSRAHADLAMAMTTRTHFVADRSYLERGKIEALRALALAPNSVDSHRALASVYFQEGKFEEAFEEEIRTIEIGGVTDKMAGFVAMVLDMLGRPDRALNWYPVASNLQPAPGWVNAGIGDCWMKLGDDEQAFLAYDRAIELQPAYSQGFIAKCRLHLLRGEIEAARQLCRARYQDLNGLGEMAQIAAQVEFFSRNYAAAEELYSKLMKSDAEGGGSFYGAISYRSALGRIKQELGANEQAGELLREALAAETAAFNAQPRNPEAVYRLAAVEACLNQTDAAMQHLRQAIALGWLDYRSLQKDPRFDSLQTQPELDTLINGLSAKVAELRSKTRKDK